VGDVALWPRKGPSHTYGQIVRPQARGGLFYFVKFAGNEPGAANGESYEAWAWDDHWIYQLEDASAYDADTSTDVRMWPRFMQIGEAHAFHTGEHEKVWHDRLTCRETKREPWQRKMWLHEVNDWDWGPDLGKRETVLLVYDATAGIHLPGRYIEINRYAKGAGSCRWEPHKSWICYANSSTANFTDASRADRKDFYLIGGPNPQPKLLACVPQEVPNYPPWEQQPKPQPYPPVTGVSMQNEQGWLIGPGDKALAMNAQGKVTFERYQLTDADLLEASALAGDSKGRASVRSVSQGLYLGADATQYSPVGVCGQYYGVPTVGGNYEKWTFGQWASGIVEAAVDYIDQGADHGRHWKAAGLTWVKKS